MKLSEKILKTEEKATLNLRALYESYGYKKYKMQKFEEYDFYLENKSFLKTENIITFTDLSGKLMALKPDVTLSIVKNTKYEQSQKVYYSENVYRTSQGTREFKEIMQVGLEYIGNIDTYETCEVIYLAAKSLELINKNYILDISHMAFVTGLLESENVGYEVSQKLLKYISEKNQHEILSLCKDEKLSDEFAKKLSVLSLLYGSFESVLPKMKDIISNDKMKEAYMEIETIYNALKQLGIEKNVHLDFSIINDLDYYNGIIFQGFIENIPCNILSGGRYDNLIWKFGRDDGAIGFALYFDILSMYDSSVSEYDVDNLIIYDENADAISLLKEVNNLTKKGEITKVQKENSGNIKYKTLYKFTDRGLLEIEKND